jgi:chromosome segregation protein
VRLSSIKLSGFKSFAEPTTFMLPGQLIGVVGPNGCGKSNIMDAVRWVLGESRASELRGESMQDVIFNGTTSRKPASRASVELIFENADHRAGGQWNQYNEIAVKRVLTRDGTSSYFINNQAVRRRDVQDVFLGTGLGPRAYAIIGQGTISRIIESKPEELRLFLEEAAGVSKYKERRRETENRLEDTRENLTRVSDILRELNANLDKLEKQAEVAAKYRELQQGARLRQHQFWLLKQRAAEREQAEIKAAIDRALNDIEQRMAELRSTENGLETLRQAHLDAGGGLNDLQRLFYDAGAEVSRLESEIRFVADSRRRVEARLAELKSQGELWLERKSQAELEVEELAAKAEQAEEQATSLAEELAAHTEALPGLQDAATQAQAAVQQQRGAVVAVQQQIQVLAAESRGASEQQRAFSARRERLAAEKRGLNAPDEQRLADLGRQKTSADEAFAAAEVALAGLTTQVPALDAERRERQQALNLETAKQSDIAARLSALKALQERVQTEGKLKPWLAKNGLEGLQAVWTQVHTEPGWEPAMEGALRERLQALPVGRLDTVKAFAGEAGQLPGKLAFYAAPPAGAPQPAGRWPALADKLRLNDAGLRALFADWLHGLFAADSLDAALAQRDQLAAGEAFITQAGHCVTRHSLSLYAPDDERAGLLARAQEIENLSKQVRAQNLIVDEARTAQVKADAAYSEAAAALAAARNAAAAAQTRAHEVQVQWLRVSQEAQAARERTTQLDDELAEVDAQLEALAAREVEAQAKLEQLDMQLGNTQEREAELQDKARAAEQALAHAREALRQAELKAQEARFSAQAVAARRAELARSIDTAAQQIATAADAQTSEAEALARLSDVTAQAGLQAALALKSERELALGAKRSEYDDLTAKLRAAEEQRMALERSVQPLRDSLNELQLEEQAARLGAEQFAQQLAEAEANVEEVQASIEQGDVRLSGLQGEVERLNREIAALGAVNLAALDELTSARERKTFLDAQSADLNEAIATLEDAIKKIDAETRVLLGNTFNTVNEHFGKMFPSLFGGGQARLVMTGEEILDAGVQVMAQPPGKKNQTIHLLSGGEKALTAIALVFAIFQLNPAPFCLLDEVDAPLDDANTERYAKLVKTMAEATQFLFISHNKIAMEMAGQLIGVTMQEQGVSRVVAVDMESAAQLAEAA